MRTLTLELLRHGPAHNQLLSPLTPYLALCENHPAVTLQLPMEHNQLLHRLGALSYRLGEGSRGFQLHDTARLLADILGGIPGLTADMNRQAGGAAAAGDGITHLRLVLSASELALLPFELTLSPPGCPAEGQPLLLQSLSPVCITRETRRVAETQLVWPDETRLLFVVASPAGAEPVPALAHLLALRQRIEPWVGRAGRLGRHLTVLSHASLEDIEAACAASAFTHVHILAHGCEYRDGYDTRFGLMLHRAGDPEGAADIVSGERLASALRTPGRPSQAGAGGSAARLGGPAVVTLASCNSGAVGSIAGVGASIAHALHQAGIPLVIASQFPLSFGGSVRMVEALYDGLLWGEDPRSLLVELRRKLHAQFPDTHDWASLTAYSSLPADFDTQLAQAQIQRAMASIDVALDIADEVVARLPREAPPAAAADTPAELMQALDNALARVRAAKQRLQDTMARHNAQRARILGLLASTEKREAALSHERRLRTPDGGQQAQHEADLWASLDRARALYFSCYALEHTPYWTTQYLSLTTVLRSGGRLGGGAEGPGRDSAALWTSAEVQALHDAASGAAQARVWALGNLIELYLLAPAVPGLAERGAGWAEMAATQARAMVDGTAEGAFERFSTRRQVQRYLDWYAALPGTTLPPQLLEAAAAVLAVLPAQAPAAWNYGTG
ncbi:MAG: CHAT domain-containing protein [Burkholderiaceae bacterium]|nr:CHAT domain-containing protein [Burkholderiaceae bacterium]